jgi:hypothetical protein
VRTLENFQQRNDTTWYFIGTTPAPAWWTVGDEAGHREPSSGGLQML